MRDVRADRKLVLAVRIVVKYLRYVSDRNRINAVVKTSVEIAMASPVIHIV